MPWSDPTRHRKRLVVDDDEFDRDVRQGKLFAEAVEAFGEHLRTPAGADPHNDALRGNIVFEENESGHAAPSEEVGGQNDGRKENTPKKPLLAKELWRSGGI